MGKNMTTGRALVRIVLIALASLVFLAVCALSTTPLLEYTVGQDAAFFRLVGQGMTQGRLPYRDYFDMKGPYLFLMEYLGQCLVPGRGGAFLLEWVCLFVTMLFSVKCWDLAASRPAVPLVLSAALLLPMGYVLSFTMTGGNLTEELSLPFLMPCLYLFLRYLSRCRLPSPENQDHPVAAGFSYGVAFGVMTMIRVTNAALIGAILLTAVCNLLVWRRFRNLLANAAAFLMGAALGVLPAILWAGSLGILSEMLNQVFLFGLRYSGESGLLESLASMGQVRTCLALLLLPGVPLAVYRVRDWRLWLFFASSALTVLLAALMGNGYCHYFVLVLPNMAFAAFLFLQGAARGQSWRKEKRRLCLVLTVALSLGLLGIPGKLFRERAFEEVRYAMYCARYDCEEREAYDAVQALLEKIPAEEREGIYVYGLPSCSAWYLQAGVQPPMKYCDWQPHYIRLVPEIGAQIEAFLSSGAAPWVVTGKEAPQEEFLARLLESDYTLCLEAGNYRLWQSVRS